MTAHGGPVVGGVTDLAESYTPDDGDDQEDDRGQQEEPVSKVDVAMRQVRKHEVRIVE